MLTLKIIIASTRPGRKGPAVAKWIAGLAREHPAFETELIDLALINLPFLDEPDHPRLRKYIHQHTREWSALIDRSDAFIIVTPEYNYGFPAPIKNALDYLHQEWHYKPVALVSYGGVAAGTRAVQMLKPVLTSLKMMPLFESINIPYFTKHIDADGVFHPAEGLDKAAVTMLDELARWGNALKSLRISGRQ